MKRVILIPSCVQTEFQAELLKKCLLQVRKVYNDNQTDIVVFKDNSNEYFPVLKDCIVIDAYVKKGGEINPYIFASKNSDDYDIFIFIHDSVLLERELPEDFMQEEVFRSLWYSDKYIEHGTNIEYHENIKKIYTVMECKIHEVCFGAMGIWTKEFAKFLANHTTFQSISSVFTDRKMRTFFERFLVCLVSQKQTIVTWRKRAICGNIFNHKNAFYNTDTNFREEIAGNPFALKLWQKR